MADNSILSEIQTLNLSYLMLAQRLVREEGTAAMYRLGISTEVGMKLKDMTINQLLRMSKANVLLCTFKYHDQASMLELMGSENKEEGPALIHAAILSAGNPPKVEHAL